MRKSRILRLQTLIDKGACADQVELFRSAFGDSVNVTQKLCVSVADKFNWGWAALNLLSTPGGAEYDRIRARAFAKGYNWAEYDRIMARAFAKGYNS